jgi:hypothetical protein
MLEADLPSAAVMLSLFSRAVSSHLDAPTPTDPSYSAALIARSAPASRPPMYTHPSSAPNFPPSQSMDPHPIPFPTVCPPNACTYCFARKHALYPHSELKCRSKLNSQSNSSSRAFIADTTNPPSLLTLAETVAAAPAALSAADQAFLLNSYAFAFDT